MMLLTLCGHSVRREGAGTQTTATQSQNPGSSHGTDPCVCLSVFFLCSSDSPMALVGH